MPITNEHVLDWELQTHEFSVEKHSSVYLLGSRFFDIFIAGIVSVFILIWLIPLLTLAIKLTSAGPALFKQLRTGRHGRPFVMWKFRTMRSRLDSHFQQATQDDHRITRIGKFLRQTDLDEMPQFINVLLGDMSIVGPRPHPIPLDAQHWHTLPGYKERYAIRPGITGLAQVRGARGETRMLYQIRDRIRYDHWYIRHKSIGLDIKIVWWTFKILINNVRAELFEMSVWKNWNFTSNTVFSTVTGGAMLGSLFGTSEAVIGGIIGGIVGAWSERIHKLR